MGALMVVAFPNLPLSTSTMPELTLDRKNFIYEESYETLQSYKANKIVLVIFDGLSYRFTKWDYGVGLEGVGFWGNKMKYLWELGRREPENLIHLEKWIDGPTWTKFC
jgi:hypothetical protein